MKKIIKLVLLATLIPLALSAAPQIVKPGIKSATAFAIFADSRTYAAATAEIDAYRSVLEQEGLGTYLLVDDWKSPDAIREQIVAMIAAQPPLEGVVFIGEIPVVMARDAQHLTSAFKSNQNRDWKDSSVPTDRFYDDPALKFDFIRQDADQPLLFYYSLSPDSPQHIASPIYSARMRPPHREGIDADSLLRNYLHKVVAAHRASNALDNLFVFRGHGYNSEAPEAWAGEQISLREQLPLLFTPGNKVRFYDFESRWPMKPYLFEKMGQSGVDVALCHHHGAPDMQYINGYRNGSDINTSITNIRLFLRSKLDRAKDLDKRKAELIASYGVPAAWCELNDSLRIADSIYNYLMDIHLEDLHERSMNPRFVLFDACYNGSFHQDDCIATSYIFGSGDCIVTQGNSVNALQDKWPDRYLGLLDCGVCIGEWGRHVHYLETHLIGDPTYRFTNRALPGIDLGTAITLRRDDPAFWLKMFRSDKPADVQALALRMLNDNGYPKIDGLLQQGLASPYGSVRLEALTLMSTKHSPDFNQALAATADDSYELIRRMMSIFIAECGDNALIPTYVTMMTEDDLSRRVGFHVEKDLIFFNADSLAAEMKRQAAAKPYLDRNNELLEARLQRIANQQTTLSESFAFIRNKENKMTKRISEITYFRNYRHHDCVPELITLSEDNSMEIEIRTTAIEALGWFRYSYRRAEIEAMCARLLKSDQPAIATEALRTTNRLRAY